MNRHLMLVRSSREISLVSRRRGRAFLALLALEIAIFVVYFVRLAAVADHVLEVMLPLAGCLALMAWTASHIAADMRLSLDLTTKTGRLVRVSPLTGRRISLAFALCDVADVALRQARKGRSSNPMARDCAIEISLRDGRRLEFRTHAADLSLQHALEQFCSAAGISRRISRSISNRISNHVDPIATSGPISAPLSTA